MRPRRNDASMRCSSASISGNPAFVDFFETTEIAGERAHVVIDALLAQIFEQVVVSVNAVERCVSWMRFVKVPEQIVHEMRQRFRNGHGS